MTTLTSEPVWTWPKLKRKRDENDESESDDCEEEGGGYIKYSRLSIDPQNDSPQNFFQCELTPHCSSSIPPFSCFREYEIHYQDVHTQVCTECSRILPTAHLLDLHLSECHSPYFAILSQRTPSYCCFVDNCETRSTNPDSRILHLRSVHKYPKKFNYDIILGEGKKKHGDGKKKRAPKKTAAKDTCINVKAVSANSTNENAASANSTNVKAVSVAKDASTNVKAASDNSNDTASKRVQEDAMDIDTLSSKMSNLMIPRSIKFGGRGGLQKHGGVAFSKIKSMHQDQAPK